jgi:L-histidine N-alpha-methyltransferase
MTEILVDRSTGAEHRLEFAEAVRDGLSGDRKTLPCRYLYDARGSELFERITEQPEYYLTRTEAGILEVHGDTIAGIAAPACVAELGSGTAKKTGTLLRAMGRRLGDGTGPRYLPIDVSKSAIEAARRTLTEQVPGLRFTGICGTYEAGFERFPELSPLLLLFLGSTIGNFDREECRVFLRAIRDHLAPGDLFLLGVDLHKDTDVLEAAYDDAAGVSAEFTRNLFARMNRELGAEIDLASIRHEAHYDAAVREIRIHARFLTNTEIRLDPLDESVVVREGERVLTEVSRKYVLPSFEADLESWGLRVRRRFTDDRGWFALLLLER